jgi:hypothetical protein
VSAYSGRSLILVAVLACGGGRTAAPPPATPVVAEPDASERPAAEVCGALVDDLERYLACLPDERKPEVAASLDRAKIDLGALGHPGITDDDRTAAARACRKADEAVREALRRC